MKKKSASLGDFRFVFSPFLLRISDFGAGIKMRRVSPLETGHPVSTRSKRALIFLHQREGGALVCPGTPFSHSPPPLPPPLPRPFTVSHYMHFTQVRAPVHSGLPQKHTIPLVPACNPRVGFGRTTIGMMRDSCALP